MVTNEERPIAWLTDRPSGISPEQWAIHTGSIPQRFLLGAHELDHPDLAYAISKGGDPIDGPVILTDEPTGDAMHWTPQEDD